MKFDPFAVNVNPAAPAVALVGVMETSVGTGLFPTALIVNVKVFVVPPPGAGVTTVTGTVPAVVTNAALTVAVNCNPLTKEVVSDVPFHLMTEEAMKFVPFTVSVNAAAPEVTLAGEREVAVGTGLVATGLMVNTTMFELPPPGVPLNTVILAVPAVAISGAVTAAVNCVALTKVVVSGLPFQFTTDPLMKLVPVIVRIKAGLPAVVLIGEMVVTVGTGLLPTAVMVNVEVFDVPPPGAGVTTVIAAVPIVATSGAVTVAVNCNGPTNVVVSAAPFQ